MTTIQSTEIHTRSIPTGQVVAGPVVVPPVARGWSGRARTLRRLLASDDGAATAEYAVVIMAAVGFAGLLVIILKGDAVRSMLTDLVQNALAAGG